MKDAKPAPTVKKRRWRKLLVRGALTMACLVVMGSAGMKLWTWLAVPRDAPVIGASLDTAWHAQVGLTTKWYEVALTRAGARRLDLRPDDGDPEAILDEIDALFLTGGGDVDPRLYGGDAEKAALVDRARDRFELALIEGALARDMPILGVCRGIQVLNVARGGSLRNLRDDPHSAALHGIELDSMAAHEVTILEGSKLAALLGAGVHQVNSFHGQAVDEVAGPLQVAATASDGVIEAIELPDRSFVIATQWHPEIPPQQMAVLEAFVRQARAYRQRKAPRGNE